MKKSQTALFRILSLLAVAAISSPSQGERQEQGRQPLTSLSKGIGPLRQAFNRDAGNSRLLLLLSPT